jgi:excisionase family DNA binding protein
MSPVPCSRFISVKAAAQYLDVHFLTVYQMIARGQIPSIKIGRCVRVDKRRLDEDCERQMAGKGGAR